MRDRGGQGRERKCVRESERNRDTRAREREEGVVFASIPISVISVMETLRPKRGGEAAPES